MPENKKLILIVAKLAVAIIAIPGIVLAFNDPEAQNPEPNPCAILHAGGGLNQDSQNPLPFQVNGHALFFGHNGKITKEEVNLDLAEIANEVQVELEVAGNSFGKDRQIAAGVDYWYTIIPAGLIYIDYDSDNQHMRSTILDLFMQKIEQLSYIRYVEYDSAVAIIPCPASYNTKK